MSSSNTSPWQRNALLLAGFLLGAVPVSAQTHPCDVAATPNPVLTKKTVIVGFCHTQQDTNGDPTLITSFKIWVDVQPAVAWTSATGLTPTSAAANAAGLWYYEAPPVAVNKGSHIVAVSAVDADGESALSASFPFTTKGPGPKPPVMTRAR